ncbi:hypothetical protein R7Z80_24880 [Vibrio sp. 1733]|uniref:hypothetical protein n=1 Tax=Vibrio TaxID=662 RepID=UPI001B8399A9|nr:MULTISPECIES: hypothetical protein [unclassified Vibrio]MDG2670098.1 hypothetical protein [Vibrio parahaemolyticus]MDW1976604.1 hypothetical protein [Vibrio sp. Vb1980]MDW2189080.1 hypothetical protein [Vibrio sp. 1733]MDW2239026.1 hypothetical protein [Vibrio sp. 1565-1]HBC3483086.1 hypothetical protein [Vibrio parahaemolyticus]
MMDLLVRMDEVKFNELINSIEIMSQEQIKQLQKKIFTKKKIVPKDTLSDEELLLLNEIFDKH